MERSFPDFITYTHRIAQLSSNVLCFLFTFCSEISFFYYHIIIKSAAFQSELLKHIKARLLSFALKFIICK